MKTPKIFIKLVEMQEKNRRNVKEKWKKKKK